MSDETPRAQIPLIADGQAQKSITHNEAMLQVDALLDARFLDRDLTAPPGSPSAGDTYLVKATATGAWTAKDGQIAFFADGAWKFYAPYCGLVAYVVDETKLIVFNGSAWVDYASITALQNVPLVGVNTTADATNKLAVKSSAVLLDNIGNGVQTKLNKNASTDTASVLYQTGYSGRAEVGLCGDDDFHFKVSPDGSAWNGAITIARATGLATLIGDPTASLGAATKQYVDGLAKGWTAGSVLFGGSSGVIAQDNAKLFWNDTNFQLGIGTAIPDAPVTVNLNNGATVAPSSSCLFHGIAADGAQPRMVLDGFGSGRLPTFQGRLALGTRASPTALTAASGGFFQLSAQGYDGANYVTGGSFQFQASEDWVAGSATGTQFALFATAMGATGQLVRTKMYGDGRWENSGAYIDLSYSYQTPTTGFAITIANTAGRSILDPAGTLAAGTITMPAAPKDGQLCRIASTQAVTALTHSPNTGQTLKGALTTIAANGFAEYTYRSANTTWYRTG